MTASRAHVRTSTHSNTETIMDEAASARSSQATTLNMAAGTIESSPPNEYSSHQQRISTICTKPIPPLSQEDYESKSQDVQHWSGTLQRLQDARFDRQRYVMSENKDAEVSRLALTAKVERALSRRMSSQDASFSSHSRKKSAAAASALNTEKRA